MDDVDDLDDVDATPYPYTPYPYDAWVTESAAITQPLPPPPYLPPVAHRASFPLFARVDDVPTVTYRTPFAGLPPAAVAQLAYDLAAAFQIAGDAFAAPIAPARPARQAPPPAPAPGPALTQRGRSAHPTPTPAPAAPVRDTPKAAKAPVVTAPTRTGRSR